MVSSTKQRVLRSGVIIANKYRIEEAIARGGFSVIYRGTHIDMQRPVALKLMALDDQVQASWLERFEREARLASQLTHRNTVTVFDFGQDEQGFLYIVMEWIDGESLYRHLRRHGPMAPRRVAVIARDILASLHEAHQRGVLHRDLKPSNIMLTRDYEGRPAIKVLDFGIAKPLEDPPDARITQKGGFVGTPRYAAPEQLEDATLTPAADIYSLGLLMWEALVGDPAVPSLHYGECLEKHLSDTPWRLPRSVHCPPGLAAIVHRALQKEVGRRYADCRQMGADLNRWLDSDEARETTGAGFLGGASSSELGAESSADAQSDPLDEPEADGQLVSDELESDGQLPPDELEADGGQPEAQDLKHPARSPSAASSDASDDPLARELKALAEASNPVGAAEPPSSQEAAPSSSTHRQGTDAAQDRSESSAPPPDERAAPGDRRPRRPGARGADGGPFSWLTRRRALWIGLGVLIVVAGALTLQAVLSAIGKERAEEAEARAERQAEAAERRAERVEERLDDGLPSLSANTFFLALQRSGWQPVGERKESEMSDVFQTNARYTKSGDTVAVTVYETDDLEAAEHFVETTDEPGRATRFGKTAIEATPDARDGSTEAVDRFMKAVERMQRLARER